MSTERSNSILNATPTRIDELTLPDDLDLCHAMIRELVIALHQSQHDCAGVRERLDLLLRKLYGPKAERFDPNQPWLIPDMAPNAEPTPPKPRYRLMRIFPISNSSAVTEAPTHTSRQEMLARGMNL